MEPKKNKIIFQKKGDEVREMASLTKIMTCLVSIHLANELRLDIHKTWFKVSKKASDTIGTSANLTENQRVSIFDLLYGLMLPSGNDAAVTLAENFTERILQSKGKKKEI
jgi:D-alanyl-D-alanine carboxypeptidase